MWWKDMLAVTWLLHLTDLSSSQAPIVTNATHVILYQNSTKDDAISYVKLLQSRLGANDYFYGLVGSPKNEKSSKLHLDSYANLNKLLQNIHVPNKAALLNGEMASPFRDEQEEDSSSYFAGGEWLVDYGEQQLGVSWEKPEEPIAGNFEHLGMNANSWMDCITSVKHQATRCIHVLHIANHGGFYPNEFGAERLKNIFGWLKTHLAMRRKEPTLIVFQRFESGHAALLAEFDTGSLKLDTSSGIMGIVFSLMKNETTKLDTRLCYALSHWIPVVSMGRMGGLSYLLLQFDPDTTLISHMYQVEVMSAAKSIVKDIEMESKPCFGGGSNDDDDDGEPTAAHDGVEM